MQNSQAKIGIYNRDGELISEKRREKVDKKEDVLKSVIILAINENDEVYVVNLGEDSLYDEVLGGSAAGLFRVNEPTDEAAKRTTKRELGIEAEPEFLTSEYIDTQGVKRFVHYYYIMSDQSNFDINKEREQGGWRNKDFIKNNFENFLPTFKSVFRELKAKNII